MARPNDFGPDQSRCPFPRENVRLARLLAGELTVHIISPNLLPVDV